MQTTFDNILLSYGLNPKQYMVHAFGAGLINHTWKVTGAENAFVLQQINSNIFTRPQDIADNLQLLAAYLKEASPTYLFAAPMPAKDGKYLVELDGAFFRLAPFVAASHTVNFLTKSTQAYQAALQFGRFSFLLRDFDIYQLKYTLADFHNLTLRIAQFKAALANAPEERKAQASSEIKLVQQQFDIAQLYEQIVSSDEIPLRVIHHDTKINNVLFDDADNGLGVIDLDTVMPGYYISDVGDMMRTYLAEANEEEQDLDKIIIREDFFAAIYAGYMSQMRSVLTAKEKELFTYAGKFMIYMQAVRFLTDFLNGDVYYQIKYAGHNLARAKNQLRLLELYVKAEPKFEQLICLLNDNRQSQINC
jgi:Ser/Thr protein kinase RdoA (MazF antagonist)